MVARERAVTVRSAKHNSDAKAARKAAGQPVRGDRTAGRAKTPWGPKGGRNAGGRGR